MSCGACDMARQPTTFAIPVTPPTSLRRSRAVAHAVEPCGHRIEHDAADVDPARLSRLVDAVGAVTEPAVADGDAPIGGRAGVVAANDRNADGCGDGADDVVAHI